MISELVVSVGKREDLWIVKVEHDLHIEWEQDLQVDVYEPWVVEHLQQRHIFTDLVGGILVGCGCDG